jgi:hypothetical protein
MVPKAAAIAKTAAATAVLNRNRSLILVASSDDVIAPHILQIAATPSCEYVTTTRPG